MPPLFPATLALYAVACALYLAHLMAGSVGLARAARGALAAAFASQALDIGWLCMQGQHPVVNAREALSFAAWLICCAYLLASVRIRIPVVGALVVPVTMVLDLAARLSPSKEVARGISTLGAVHITLATAGVALFAVAAGGAVIYLIEERALKAHRAGRLFKRGAALETLDTLNRRCITLGFPLYTIAMVTGAMWVAQLHLNGVFTVQYAISAAAWLLYAGLLLARVTAGWRGRRAALITLAGFAATAAVVLIYFVRGLGSAQG